MITGKKEELDQYVQTHRCPEHDNPLVVAWHAGENNYVIRCGAGHFPDEIVPVRSRTAQYKQGEIEAVKMFDLKCPKCNKVFSGEIWEKVADDYSKHIADGCQPEAAAFYPNLTDVVPEEVLKGNLVSMDELIGKTILVKEFVFRESTYKEDTDYLSMTIELDGEEKVVNTGAERIVQVFKALNPAVLPAYAIFEKITLPNGRRVFRIKA